MLPPPPFLSFGASASSGLSGVEKKNLGGMWDGELAGNWSLVPSADHTQRFPSGSHKLGFEEIQPPPGFLPSGVLSWKKEAFAGPETPDPQPGQQSQPYCPCLLGGQGIAQMPTAKGTLELQQPCLLVVSTHGSLLPHGWDSLCCWNSHLVRA